MKFKQVLVGFSVGNFVITYQKRVLKAGFILGLTPKIGVQLQWEVGALASWSREIQGRIQVYNII